MIMQQNPIIPIVGMPCCEVLYTDRYPFTIIGTREKKGKVIEVYVKPNDYEILDYYGEKYEIGEITTLSEPNTYTLRRNGRWVCKGQPSDNGRALALDTHMMRIDPSF